MRNASDEASLCLTLTRYLSNRYSNGNVLFALANIASNQIIYNVCALGR